MHFPVAGPLSGCIGASTAFRRSRFDPQSALSEFDEMVWATAARSPQHEPSIQERAGEIHLPCTRVESLACVTKKVCWVVTADRLVLAPHPLDPSANVYAVRMVADRDVCTVSGSALLKK